MKQNKGFQLAYLAGVIDSDGCIAIKKTTKKSYKGGLSPSYNLQILINSPDGRIIDWCYGMFGGNIYSCQPYQEDRKLVWRWQINGEKAAEICKKLLPFLRYKKNQAEMAWRFQCLFNRQNKNLSYRCERLTENEINQREELYRKLRELKQIFIPCAAAETKRDESLKNDKR